MGRAASIRQRVIGARPAPASEEWRQRRADCSVPCRGELLASVVACQSALLHSPAARIPHAPGRGAGSVFTVGVGRRAYRSWWRAGSVRLRFPRRDHARAIARCRRAPSLTGDAARIPCRSAAAQQGDPRPADPPTIEEIVAVMRVTGDTVHGRRLRGLIAVLWRAGLRIPRGARARRGRPGSAARFAAGPGAARAAAAARSAGPRPQLAAPLKPARPAAEAGGHVSLPL
jgi:hypothetical protein